MLNKPADIFKIVDSKLSKLPGHTFDVINLSKPQTMQEAINLSKIVSKLSPLVGNLIEYKMVDFFNSINELQTLGKWKRQDPGFPDTVFESTISPAPGFEIKAWFPLATEITARFKDSQNFFFADQTNVLLIAWLPEHLLFGRPKVLGVCNVSGKSVAEARDTHYFNPPDYLVLEPEDTSTRTVNLQQTNTNGYKFQGTQKDFEKAQQYLQGLPDFSPVYEPTPEYQAKVRNLVEKFKYRLDTNYAKIDRIEHDDIESFKTEMLDFQFNGLPIKEWAKIIASSDEKILEENFKKYLPL